MSVKIMVVDDEIDLESLIRQKFRKKIRENEYEFVFAHNGLEALSKLIEHPDIGVIFTDINMPEMDGLTLLSKLNELKNPSLKTVIVSAYGDMENIRTAMNRGAFDFLVKPIDFNDLEITINKTVEQMLVLRKAMKEHDQLLSIQHDLSVAREIQQAILPKNFPPYPNRKDFDIYAYMLAAKEVGGDFYDFFLIDNDRLGFVIGDVSGKGVPAAIFMAVSRTLIRATGSKGMAPGDCMSYVNNLLCNESVSSMFVTVFYGILNAKTGEIKYSCAGHNPPYVVTADGQIKIVEQTGDMVLGIFEGTEFKEKSLTLNPGDSFFLYTDGVTEAFNAQNEPYAEERLENTLKKLYNVPIDKVISGVIDDVSAFVNGHTQSDDITTLVLRYQKN
jgi:phosphoserine phosphatase RsbU/P